MKMPIELPTPAGPLERQVISGATMGTRYAAVLYAPSSYPLAQLGQALQAAVDTVDGQMSTWKPDSALMQLNRSPVGTWFDAPPELCTVLAASLEIGRQSDGAFDIGVGDLVSAWGFGSAQGRRDLAAIHNSGERRPAHACLEVDRERCRVRKQSEVTLDLSGIAKGFGVDELARVLALHGIGHFLVSIDGELRAAGGKPDGSPWRIAVEKPQPGRRDAEGIVELRSGAIATSGDYRHFVDVDGIRYGHTIDPRRHAPLVGGPAAVTVLAETCMAADAWVTALLVLGPAAGGELAARFGLEAIYMGQPGDLFHDTATSQPAAMENQL